MGDFYKINEHDFVNYDTEYDNKVTVVKADDGVDCWWGLNKIIVTIEDIEELKQGKFWYFNDGEYATVIGLKRGERKHGRWIKVDEHTIKCSECGNYLDMRGVNAGRGDANFCPNCGMTRW